MSSCVQHTTLSRSRITQLDVVSRTKSQPEGAEKIVWIYITWHDLRRIMPYHATQGNQIELIRNLTGSVSASWSVAILKSTTSSGSIVHTAIASLSSTG